MGAILDSVTASLAGHLREFVRLTPLAHSDCFLGFGEKVLWL